MAPLLPVRIDAGCGTAALRFQWNCAVILSVILILSIQLQISRAAMVLDLIDQSASFCWKDSKANNLTFVAVATTIYVSFILLHRSSNRIRQLTHYNGKIMSMLTSVHNLVLCIGSLCMFVGCLWEVYRRATVEGHIWLICESVGVEAVGNLYYYSFLYHLSKYYELLDTLLQLFSGKTPPNYFLHVYHHAAMIGITWLWLETGGSLQFIGILFNTAVHVVMYYYYFLKSIGITPVWKNWVTKFQIVQFICSLVAFCGTMIYHFNLGGIGRATQCKGMQSVYVSIVFNLTLLLGFVSILKTNSKSRKVGDSTYKRN